MSSFNAPVESYTQATSTVMRLWLEFWQPLKDFMMWVLDGKNVLGKVAIIMVIIFLFISWLYSKINK